MQSLAEPHARNSWINLRSVHKHPDYHLQGTRQIRHRLRMHGLRECGSEDEGEAGSASGTDSEDLLWVVTWNRESVAASGMRLTSAVRLRC